MKRWIAVLLASLALPAMAQERPVQVVIDDYVAQALRSNLALQGATISVEQARATLDQARARYLPELSLSARYTENQGGRDIVFPVGSLLNPVYSTLNDMLVAQGGQARFGALEDQTFPLLRPHEQDTHLSVRQPLFAPAIRAGVRAQEAVLGATEQQRLGVARQLKRDVTVAYLNWLQATSAVDIVASTRTLLEENLRINRSLFDNGRVTEDQPLRAQAELSDIEQQGQQARDAQAQARSYVNFLLNRPLDAAVEPGVVPTASPATTPSLEALRAQAAAQRPELGQLDRSLDAAREQVKVARAEALPSLALGVDAGIQGEKYGVGSDYNYASASLLLTWKLFAGGGLKAQEKAAAAQARRIANEREWVDDQIALQVQQALDSYRTATASVATAQARLDAAAAAYRIASRKRDEGVISQAEYLDASTARTRAELNLNVTRYGALKAAADLDFATAAGPLPLQ
jgi:outer membrane protein